MPTEIYIYIILSEESKSTKLILSLLYELFLAFWSQFEWPIFLIPYIVILQLTIFNRNASFVLIRTGGNNFLKKQPLRSSVLEQKSNANKLLMILPNDTENT